MKRAAAIAPPLVRLDGLFDGATSYSWFGVLTGGTLDCKPMATCLITGGAGFLGSHLADELLRRGNRVICVDNLETGSLANIEHIRTDDFVHLHDNIIE